MLQVSSSHTLCQLQRHGKHHARDSFSASPCATQQSNTAALKHGRRWGARRLGVFTAANLRVSMSSTKAQASTKVPKHGATFEGQKMSWLGSASFSHAPGSRPGLGGLRPNGRKAGPWRSGAPGKASATGDGPWSLETRTSESYATHLRQRALAGFGRAPAPQTVWFQTVVQQVLNLGQAKV